MPSAMGRSKAEPFWREVDGDASQGEGKAGVDQRRAHPLPAFLDGALGQADGGEGWEPVGDVDLDVHRVSIDPEDGCGTDSGKHGWPPLETPKG